jgi:hypothetical protein
MDIQVVDITLRNWVNDLEEEGLVHVYKNKGLMVQEDFWREYHEEDLERIYMMIKFMEQVLPFSLQGSTLDRTLDDYRTYYREATVEKETTPFNYLHKHYHSVIDEDMAWKLNYVAVKGLPIKLEYNAMNSGNVMELQLLPIKVIYNQLNGVWYLGAVNYMHQVQMFRIERCNSFEVIDYKIDYPLDYDPFKYSWGINPLQLGEEPFLVEALVHIPKEENKKFIIGKINREKKWGIFNQVNETTYSLKIPVSDITEIKPWIKQFGQYITVMPSSKHDLAKIIKEDIKELLARYGNE